MIPKQTSSAILAIISAALTGMAQQSNSSIATSSNAAAVQHGNKAFQINDLTLVDGEEAAARRELTKKINELVSAKNLDGFDKLADDLRTSKAQIANGTWRLLSFYRILTYEWTDTADVTEEMWKARLDLLNSWIKTKPTSITARIALARYYKNYAWDARGLGYGNTVTENGWKLFAERLDQAKETLAAAKKLEPKCPVWWDTMQFVALGQSWDVTSYEKLFDEATAVEPTYVHFYNNKVNYLLPRWFGQEGDWQKFAWRAADRIGGDEGDILYARIGWRVHERQFYGGFLRDAGYSWPRMKKGMEAIIKQYPDSQTAASELAYLAYQAHDRACARPLFEGLGANVDRSVWLDDKPRFLRARAWAIQNDTPP